MASRRQEQRAIEIECDDWDQLYPGRFLKSAFLDGPTDIEITRVVRVKDAIGTTNILHFRPLPGVDQTEAKLNKINGIALRAILGRKPRNWVGHVITIQPSVVEQGKYKDNPTIRVCGSPELEQDMPDFIVDVGSPFWKPFRMPLRNYSRVDQSREDRPRPEPDVDAGPAVMGPGLTAKESQLIMDLETLLEDADDQESVKAVRGAVERSKDNLPIEEYEGLKRKCVERWRSL